MTCNASFAVLSCLILPTYHAVAVLSHVISVHFRRYLISVKGGYDIATAVLSSFLCLGIALVMRSYQRCKHNDYIE